MATGGSSTGTIYSPLPQSISDADTTEEEEEEEELNSVGLGRETGSRVTKTPHTHGPKGGLDGRNAHPKEQANQRTSGGHLQPNQPANSPGKDPQLGLKTIEVEDNFKEESPKVLWNKLRIAASTGNIDLVKTIIAKRNVSVDQVLQNGWSASMFAAAGGQADVLEFLLENGADPNFHKEKYTALMAACASTSAKSEDAIAKCVNSLLYHGANKTVVTRHGMSALMFACKEGHLEAVKLLMENGEGLNLQDSQGWTALFWAVRKNHLQIVEALVVAGADIHICDKSGNVAFNVKTDLSQKKIDALESKAIIESEVNEGESLQDLKLLIYLLSGMNQLSLLGTLRAHNVSAEKLLAMTDSDLEKIGITDSLQRVCIHIAISKFHAMEWSKKSLISNVGSAFRPQDAVVVLENMVIHLKTMSATVRYVRHAVEGKRVAIPVNTISEQKLLLEKSDIVMKQLDLVSKDVKFLMQNLVKMQGLEDASADFIAEKKIQNKSSKLISFAIMAAVVAGLAWKSKSWIPK